MSDLLTEPSVPSNITKTSILQQKKRKFDEIFDAVDLMELLLGIERFRDFGWPESPNGINAVKYNGVSWNCVELTNLACTCKKMHRHLEWMMVTHKLSTLYDTICFGRRALQRLGRQHTTLIP